MDKIDILNRDKYVERLLKIIQNISETKKSKLYPVEWTPAV